MFYNIYHIFLNQRNGNRFPGWYYDHIYQRFQFSFFFLIYIYMYWDGYIEMGKRATDNNGFQNYTRIDQYR